MSDKPFHYQDPFPLGAEATEYELLTTDHITVGEFEGKSVLKIAPEGLTLLAAEAVEQFGVVPKVALLSHSSFGASNAPNARKMREALALIHDRAPDLEVDGEMHADAALSEALRNKLVMDGRLSGSANLLVMPTLDAANISLTLLSAATEGLLVGPIFMGMSLPLHVLTPAATARGIVNMTALAAVQSRG